MQCTSVGSLAVERERAMTAQRIVRELEVIALADEEPERPLEVLRRLRWDGEAPSQQRGRGGELIVLVVVRERLGDVRTVDPELAQAALDALVAPLVEVAPVLGEALGKARVVHIAALAELVEDLLDQRGLDVIALQARDHLRLGALAVREVPPCGLEGRVAELVGVRRGFRVVYEAGASLVLGQVRVA